jgi:hypothetical protein
MQIQTRWGPQQQMEQKADIEPEAGKEKSLAAGGLGARRDKKVHGGL